MILSVTLYTVIKDIWSDSCCGEFRVRIWSFFMYSFILLFNYALLRRCMLKIILYYNIVMLKLRKYRISPTC